MKRTVAYVKYSSDRQSDTSIEAQLSKILDEYGKLRKKYVINKNETPIVREIFERAAQGHLLHRNSFRSDFNA